MSFIPFYLLIIVNSNLKIKIKKNYKKLIFKKIKLFNT